MSSEESGHREKGQTEIISWPSTGFELSGDFKKDFIDFTFIPLLGSWIAQIAPLTSRPSNLPGSKLSVSPKN